MVMKNTMHKMALLTVLSLAGVGQAFAQVTVQAQIDSAIIWIGEQTGLTLEVSAEKGAHVEWPEFDTVHFQQLTPGVEVLYYTPVDTQWLANGERMQLRRKYLITSFDSALYRLPPMPVRVGGDTLLSNALALKVYTFDVDTLHEDSIFGLCPQQSPPFLRSEYTTLLWLSVAILLLTAILLYVIVRLKDNKPIIRRIRHKRKLPPYQAAMKKIEQIKQEGIARAEDPKDYYTALTDTLRQYMQERYGFYAMEMTSSEIIAQLQAVNDERSINELRDLFETADLVKFAKHLTLLGENDRHLLSAIDYINQTKPTEPIAQPPAEEIIVDKKSRSTKVLLIASVIVAILVLMGLVAYLAYRIYMLS